MQRSSRQIGGQNPCHAGCFASVFLKQTVELNSLFQKDQGKTASAARGTIELNRFSQKDPGKTGSAARGTVELNRLFPKDRGKTASAARILSPNPARRPLPCLPIQSFFHGHTHYTVPGIATIL